MMKKEYVIQKQAEAKRLLGRFLFVVLVLAVVLAFVAAPSSAGQRATIGSICIIILVTFVLGGIIWIGRRTDVRCPACGKSIQGGIHTPLALTTGKCGHCGTTLIDETEAEQTPAGYVANRAEPEE